MLEQLAHHLRDTALMDLRGEVLATLCGTHQALDAPPDVVARITDELERMAPDAVTLGIWSESGDCER